MVCCELTVKTNPHVVIFILIPEWSARSDSAMKIFPVRVQIQPSLLFNKDGRGVVQNTQYF